MIGTSLHTLVQMVDNGLGVTILPEMAIDAGILHDTHIVARPLKSAHANREIALIWRKNSPQDRGIQAAGRGAAERVSGCAPYNPDRLSIFSTLQSHN